MIGGTWLKCSKCKSDMWIPAALNEAALNARGVISFYCSYGHEQIYTVGVSEETKLRLERNRLQQRIAERDDRIRNEIEARERTERQLSAAKGRITKIKNRVGHGVCPCCSRSFGNLAKHMATKHAGYSAKIDDDTGATLQ